MDRSEGLAGRLAEAKAVAERAGRALTKKESEGMVRAIGFAVTIYGRFLCATNRRNFISDDMTIFWSGQPRVHYQTELANSPCTAYQFQKKKPLRKVFQLVAQEMQHSGETAAAVTRALASLHGLATCHIEQSRAGAGRQTIARRTVLVP